MQSGNSNNPFVAIWMVTYNQENSISEAIESVLMQETKFNFKLYIGEDNSTDETPKICTAFKQKYPDKIELFLNKKNLGANANAQQIYKASFESGAKYISLLEGDDYWTDPLKLQKQVDFLEANLDYVLCFHQVDILKLDGEIVEDFITKVPDDYETIESLARLGNYIHTPSVIFRNIIKEFPFEFEFSPIGDYFLYLMLAENGKLKFLEEKMAVYRYGVGFFSGTSKLQNAKSNHMLFVCLLSYLKDEHIKKIIFERQKGNLNFIESLIRNEYDDVFVSRNLFFQTINSLMKDYKNPEIIIKKVKAKIFKNAR